jgi:hypothetical protein
VFHWSSGASNNFPQLLGTSTANSGFRVGADGSGSIGSTQAVGLVKGGVAALSTVVMTAGVPYVLVTSHRQDTGEYYILMRSLEDGSIQRNTQTNTSASSAGNGSYGVGIARTDFNGSWSGDIALAFASFDFLRESAGLELLANPWQLFEPQRIFVPVTAAAGSHDTSGALSSDAAAIAGTAAHLTLHATSGALASDAATIAGTATHLTLHATSGALAADAGVIAGAAEHAAGGEHATDGALTSDPAAIAGTAAHYTLHATTGALAAEAATIAGTAAHLTLHTTSGALAADPATMAGVAVHSGAGAVQPGMQGAGRPSRRRSRVVEIDGEDFVVSSAEEAQALLDQAKEQAKELAAVAVKRAAEAKKRPVNKVVKDARRLLEVPEIQAPEEFAPLVSQTQDEIRSIYQSALASVEIAALLAKRQREEEDDEDVLLLLI